MRDALRVSLLALFIASPATGAVIGEAKKPYEDRPEDVPREHVERITNAQHEYAIEFTGTIDGCMTRAPIGYAAFQQGWQPNRSVLFENIGDTDVHNPWIVVNGRGDWRTLESIVAEATRGCVTEAEKARAIWEFVRRRRFHACTWDAECSDALKALNVYGYTLCGNQARVLNDLWKAAGLTTRRCYPIGHVVGEVLLADRYQMMDSDEHVICLLRDNQTIASGEEIVRDHDLVKRTHTYGIGRQASRKTDEFSASLYVHEGTREGDFGQSTRHLMDLVLRPGESIELRWDHIGKQYTAGVALKEGERRRDGLGDLLEGWGPTAYDKLRNGKLRYRPDLTSTVAQCGTDESDNVIWDTSAKRVQTDVKEQPAQVTWAFASPYVFVGGRTTTALERDDKASAAWSYSSDGKEFLPLTSTSDEGQSALLEAILDDVLSPRGSPTYRFWLRLTLRGCVSAGQIAFEHDIQTSALGLPELPVGSNGVVYTDSSPGERSVRITHRWLERSTWHPPNPPTEAIAPGNGAVVEGTQVRFAWNDASDPDGDEIADYHFELSAYPDMRWPLSPNFDRQVSLTPSRGKPEWSVPYAGLLNPDTTYYWRVRAMDAKGVWGTWSPTFHFQIRAPGVPLDLELSPVDEGGWTLSWTPNPNGRQPVVYKVYGSDEQGFSISDKDYQVFRGKGFVRNVEEYDAKPADAPDAGLVNLFANLITQTSETQLRVIGSDLELPNTNKAFYRVVAVDAQGNESGPSDYAEVFRPYVHSRPTSPARVNETYQYQPEVIRSIGDLRCRRSETSSYNAAFWDREEISFRAIRLPVGLSQDPQTGLISGTTQTTGEFDMEFEVSVHTGRSAIVTQKVRVVE